METTVYRVYTAPTSSFARSDRKRDFHDFDDAKKYAVKQGMKVTGFVKITTADVEWR